MRRPVFRLVLPLLLAPLCAQPACGKRGDPLPPLNIHPSLLPRHRGLHTHQHAIEAGDAEHGATVHFVVPELDAGPIVLQARVAVERGDTADALGARVLQHEHRIYPQAIRWFAEGRLRLVDGIACLDGKAV